MSIEAKDLIDLINACCKHDRTFEVKFKGVSLKIGSGEKEQVLEQKSEIQVQDVAAIQVESERARVQENVEAIEDRLANILIENPALYEQLEIERELELGSEQNTFN